MKTSSPLPKPHPLQKTFEWGGVGDKTMLVGATISRAQKQTGGASPSPTGLLRSQLYTVGATFGRQKIEEQGKATP